MSAIFKFKQFEVDQSGCAMKINTDGVLLGAMADAPGAKMILDIGTGTGVIALMLAQRFSHACLHAVEIDSAAAATANKNFSNSAVSGRLQLFNDDFADFFKQHPSVKYDLIISNPPFYINSLASKGEKRILAKHAGPSFFEDLMANVANHLTTTGLCWLILPLQTAQLVKDIAHKYQLHLQNTISIKSYPDSIPHREILVLNKINAKQVNKEFVIYAAPKVYSAEYQMLLEPFFTIF